MMGGGGAGDGRRELVMGGGGAGDGRRWSW